MDRGNSNRLFNVGIIGCGGISAVHFEALVDMADVKIQCVCDIDESLAAATARKYGCNYVIDYKELISDEEIDVVHILTPHYLHVPMAIECLKAHKNVVLEKPVGISYEQLIELKECSEASSTTIGVTFQNRFNDTTIKTMEIIDSGLLGEIKAIKGSVCWCRHEDYYLKSSWRGRLATEGGGLLINQAIHTLDLMDYFGGGAISVKGCVENHTHEFIEVEDTAMVTMYFNKDVQGCFYGTNSYGENSSIEIELLFAKGKLQLKNQCLYLVQEGSSKEIADDLFKEGEKSYWGMSHKKCIDDIYDAIGNGLEPMVTLDGAIRATRVVLSIYESSESKEVVML